MTWVCLKLAPKFSWWGRWGVKPLHGTGFPMSSPSGPPSSKPKRRCPGFPGQPRCSWGAPKSWNKICSELELSGTGVNQRENLTCQWRKCWRHLKKILDLEGYFANVQTQSSIMASWHCPIRRLHWTGGHCVALGSLFGFQASSSVSGATRATDVFPPRSILVKLFAFRIWLCPRMGKNCHEMMGHMLNYDDSPWDSGPLVYRGMDPWEHCCWATGQTSTRRTEMARCPFPHSFLDGGVNP